jgi:RNA polymerase sigma-54 factor
VPDVHVLRRPSGELVVELNSETLPRVLVDSTYAARIGRGDAPTRRFISEHLGRANWLKRSLAQRARTILRVASCIVEHQNRFFGAGAGEMRPLTRRAIAERLKLHESTVSRVAAGKFLGCERGVYPLRFFFSASVQAMAGGEAHAATAVQERIRLLIEAEVGHRALSDDRIVARLNADGIDIARRTVAKYREGMGIPSSVTRRRLRAGA